MSTECNVKEAYASPAKRAAKAIACVPVLGGMAEIYEVSEGYNNHFMGIGYLSSYKLVGYYAAGSKKYCKATVDKPPKPAKTAKKYKCPECGRVTDGHSAHGKCDMVLDRRGGWRQLGVYDG